MATDATLRRAERNTCYSLVERFGFNPEDFEWHEQDRDEWVQRRFTKTFTVSVLTHSSTGYYIVFGATGVTMSPAPDFKVQTYTDLPDPSVREHYCRTWLQELRKEIDTPDLWGTIGAEHALSDAAASSSDNRPFSPEERTTVAEQLGELKSLLVAGERFQQEQAAFVESQFSYLREASERLGRKDWLNVAFSVLIGLMVGLALEPTKVKSVLAFAGSILQWVWAGAQSLLPSQ